MLLEKINFFKIISLFILLNLLQYIWMLCFLKQEIYLKSPSFFDLDELIDWYIIIVYPLIFSVIFRYCKINIKKYFKCKILKYCKNQNNLILLEERSEKICIYIYKSIIHLFFTIFGYIILSKTDIFPYLLGGKNKNYYEFLIETEGQIPYIKNYDGTIIFSLLTMSYHWEELIDHIFFKKYQNDFYEMLVHHSITIILFIGMLFCNFIRIGSLISFLHSIADFPMSIAKLLSQTLYKKINFLFFIIGILGWVITRNIILLEITYYINYLEWPLIFNDFSRVFNFKKTLLIILCFMHYYWLILFFIILYKFLTMGSNEDLQNKIKLN